MRPQAATEAVAVAVAVAARRTSRVPLASETKEAYRCNTSVQPRFAPELRDGRGR